MNDRAKWFLAVTITILAASRAAAIDIFWEGGSGTLLDFNYSDGTNTGLQPQPGDVINFGNGGSATFDGTIGLGKLRVGHNLATPGGTGQGTVTIENGGYLELTAGAAGADNAALWVGRVQNGVLNIDNATLIANRLAVIGFGNNTNRTGTVNITNGGSLTISAGNLNMGESTGGANPTGVQGHLMMSGSTSILSVLGGGADLSIGMYSAMATFTQTGGTTTINDQIIVGQRNADGSSFSVSGGTVTTGGQLIVSSGTAADGYSDNVSSSFTGNAVINLGGNLTAGSNDARNTSVLIADNAIVNILSSGAAGNAFFGRDTSADTLFTMTGGALNLGNHFLMGTATGATGIVGNHSGGTITTTNDFKLADTNGGTTYNLSDAGNINAGGFVIVGRQTATAVMHQTGGSVTAALGIHVGDAQSTNTAVFGTGTYNVSGGTITANQNATIAFTIGQAGTGTFRVIGEDGTIDVNGEMLVNAGSGSQGTLAYQLETGELLSMIDVSGTATFNAGAMLVFDTSFAAPTQATYDLLTAASIVDSGISFSGPTGWGYQIVAGGNGQILQAVQGVVPVLDGDHNGDNVVDARDYVVWRKNPGAFGGTDGYDDWRANFGASQGGGGSVSKSAGVPEPTSGGLLLILALFAPYGARVVRRH